MLLAACPASLRVATRGDAKTVWEDGPPGAGRVIFSVAALPPFAETVAGREASQETLRRTLLVICVWKVGFVVGIFASSCVARTVLWPRENNLT